jgi:hypothetical protein
MRPAIGKCSVRAIRNDVQAGGTDKGKQNLPDVACRGGESRCRFRPEAFVNGRLPVAPQQDGARAQVDTMEDPRKRVRLRHDEQLLQVFGECWPVAQVAFRGDAD